TTLKIAVLAPIPSASVSTATKVKPGLRASVRRPNRRSCARSSSRRGRDSSRDSSLKRSMPPKLSTAARRASSGGIPARTFFSVCCSTWNRISSSISRSIASRPIQDRNRDQLSRGDSMARRSSGCGGVEDQVHRLGKPLPVAPLFGELLPACLGERIEAGAAVVLRHPPLRGDPSLALQAVQGGIERSLIDAGLVLRSLLDV